MLETNAAMQVVATAIAPTLQRPDRMLLPLVVKECAAWAPSPVRASHGTGYMHVHASMHAWMGAAASN